MKLNYNLTGSERKSLVAAISQALNAPTKYLGAPTFAYEIVGYHIDKVGTLTGPDNLDLEDLLHQAGFDADGDTRYYDEPETYESGLGGMGALDDLPDIDQHHPDRYVNPDVSISETMQRQLNKQEKLALGHACSEDFQSEYEMQADDIPEEDNTYRLCIEMPLDGFTPGRLDNLNKLVSVKSPILKAALEVDDLPIQVTNDKLKFPWFIGKIDSEHIKAYTTLISMLCKTAKEKKRVTSKKKDITGSSKYAMHCFLISIGAIGPEYKQMRKILQSKLSGSSAFKEIEE